MQTRIPSIPPPIPAQARPLARHERDNSHQRISRAGTQADQGPTGDAGTPSQRTQGWSAWRDVRAITSRVSTRLCTVCDIPGHEAHVVIRGGVSLRAGVAGVTTCDSRARCPLCSARRGVADSRLMQAAFEGDEDGYAVHLVITVRHTIDQTWGDVYAGVAAAWKHATNGRRADDAAAAGLRWGYRACESHHNYENGWHVHFHVALSYKAGSDMQAERRRWFDLLREGAKRAGAHIGISGLKWDAQRLTNETAGGDLVAPGETLPRYVAKAWCHEVAYSATKKTARGRTLAGIAKGARAGEAACVALWHEYEHQTFRKRMTGWLFKGAMVAAVERAKAKAEETGDDRDTMRGTVHLDKGVWRKLARFGRADAFLADLGFLWHCAANGVIVTLEDVQQRGYLPVDSG